MVSRGLIYIYFKTKYFGSSFGEDHRVFTLTKTSWLFPEAVNTCGSCH